MTRRHNTQHEVGEVIGRLTLLKRCWIDQPKGRKLGWLCKCTCGKTCQKHVFVLNKPLIRGEHSCGCAQVGMPRGCKAGGQKNNGRQNVADPSPKEIRERCLEIQATWSEDDFARRRGDRNVGWEVPVMSSTSYRDSTGEFA